MVISLAYLSIILVFIYSKYFELCQNLKETIFNGLFKKFSRIALKLEFHSDTR